MDIKFYCPSDELIPTRLRLEVDGNGNNGKQIHYEQVKEEFAYDFTFYGFTEDEAYEAIRIIADIMESQSEDNGASWRVVEIKQVALTTIRIRFRMKDSY